MNHVRTLTLLFAAAASMAHAQVAEFGGGVGVSRLPSNNLASGYSLDNGTSIIFRMTVNNDNIFGHEFGYAYNRSKLLLGSADQGGMAIHQGFYNFLVYGTKEGKKIRPFVTGGGHYSNFVPPGASAARGQGNNKFGFNYGGGVKFRLTEKYLIRVDYRQFATGKPFSDSLPVSGWLRQQQVSVGFAFTL